MFILWSPLGRRRRICVSRGKFYKVKDLILKKRTGSRQSSSELWKITQKMLFSVPLYFLHWTHHCIGTDKFSAHVVALYCWKVLFSVLKLVCMHPILLCYKTLSGFFQLHSCILLSFVTYSTCSIRQRSSCREENLEILGNKTHSNCVSAVHS